MMLAVYAVKQGSDIVSSERLDEKWYTTYEVAFDRFYHLFKKYSGKSYVTIVILDLDSDYVMAKADLYEE